MRPLPDGITTVLGAFAPLFSRPVWFQAQLLMVGAILSQGPRTVTAALRVVGLGQEKRFEKYHRVLSQARWCGLQGAKILLGLLIVRVPPGWAVLIVVDETMSSTTCSAGISKSPSRKAVDTGGLETQRQCSDRAIARTTPALFGLDSLVCLMAYRLSSAIPMLPWSTAWYLKEPATFADVVAFVRRTIWAAVQYVCHQATRVYLVVLFPEARRPSSTDGVLGQWRPAAAPNPRATHRDAEDNRGHRQPQEEICPRLALHFHQR